MWVVCVKGSSLLYSLFSIFFLFPAVCFCSSGKEGAHPIVSIFFLCGGKIAFSFYFISFFFRLVEANIDNLLLMQSASAGIPIKKNLSAFQSGVFWSDLREIQCFFPSTGAPIHTRLPSCLPACLAMFAQEVPCVSSVGYFGCCVFFFLRRVEGRRFLFSFPFVQKGVLYSDAFFLQVASKVSCLIFSIISGMFYSHVAAFMGVGAVREEAIQTVPFSSSSFLLAIIVLLFSIVCVLPGGSKRSSISHIPVMEAFSSSAESYLVGQTFLSLSLSLSLSLVFLKKIPADFSFFPSVFSPLETKCLAVYHFDSRVFIYICHPPSMGSSHFLACTSNPRPGSALFVVVVVVLYYIFTLDSHSMSLQLNSCSV